MTAPYPTPTLPPSQILNRIRGNFSLSAERLQKLNIQTDRMIKEHPGLKAISNVTFLKEIDHPQKKIIKRVGLISPRTLFVSEKIKSLCRLNYKHSDMRVDPCGGIRKNYLACSPYSPGEAEIIELFREADLFCFLQADGLTNMKQQRYLHEILFEIEAYLIRMGLLIVMSFAAGPCRICEQCAGQFNDECYTPEKRRFSLESCGIDVDWAMEMMALKCQDVSWRIEWLKNFALEDVAQEFKSVIGILLTCGNS